MNNQPHPHPQLMDGPWLRKRYENDRVGVQALARELGCNMQVLCGALLAHGILVRPRGRPQRVQPGQRYGMLVVERELGRTRSGGGRLLECVCDCGAKRRVVAAELTRTTKAVRTCGSHGWTP